MGEVLIVGRPLRMKKQNTPRLGRAVRAAVDGRASPMIGKEKHSTNNSLRDVILGGQDGLVNMLGIALGVVAAGGSTHVLIVTGLAASITESISMGAVAYTSFGSDRDFYFAVGVYSAKTLVGDWRKSGLQMLAIGLGAAALGFLIGRLFHTMGG